MLTYKHHVKMENKAIKVCTLAYWRFYDKIKLVIDKVKMVYKNKFEKIMIAITFAEAGEFEIAEEILREGD